MPVRRSRTWILVAPALIVAACTGAEAPARSPSATAATTRSSSTTGPAAVDRVTVRGIVRHLEALQAIADDHDGTRAVGTDGYEASVEYVEGVLRDAGYVVDTPATDVPIFVQEAPTVLERIEPEPATWVDARDVRAMLFSASGDVQAPLATIGGTGCSSDDFAGFPPGAVALLTPGPCFRRVQVLNAQTAGAVAVIGVTTAAAGRPLRPTLLTPQGIEVPVLAVTAEAGDELADGDTVHVSVAATTTFGQARSVIGALPDVPVRDVVMLGGHLDSALDGPGINDNGSGVALLLELARWLAANEPSAPVRFAFWGAEELGLYGSRDYVLGLDQAKLDAIRVYLNLDMVGSPNFVTFVYEAVPADPEESRRVADLFARALARRGFESEPLDLQGASDHGSFEEAGVATGGLYSGALEHKTPTQVAAYGGTAGEPLDPCFHQPCDTIDNVSRTGLRRHSQAVVSVLLSLLT